MALVVINPTQAGQQIGSGGGTAFFGGTSDGVSTFYINGNLDLNSGDKIIGTGGNLLQIVVGNNASIPDGSLVSVSAVGQLAGAGGGSGGTGTVHPNPLGGTASQATGGGGGGFNLSDGGPGQAGESGPDGYQSYDRNSSPQSLKSTIGQAGGNGKGLVSYRRLF